MLNGYPLDSAPLNTGSIASVVELSVNAVATATASPAAKLLRATPMLVAALAVTATAAAVPAPTVTKQLSASATATAAAFAGSIDVDGLISLDAIATAKAAAASVVLNVEAALSADAHAEARLVKEAGRGLVDDPPVLTVARNITTSGYSASASALDVTLDAWCYLENTAYYYIHGAPFVLWKTKASASVLTAPELENTVLITASATAFARVYLDQLPALRASAVLQLQNATATATVASVALGAAHAIAADATATATALPVDMDALRGVSASATATTTAAAPGLFVNIDADAPDERTVFVSGNIRQVVLDKREREIHVRPVL